MKLSSQNKFISTMILFLIFSCRVSSLASSISSGRIEGKISDLSGNSIADATITLTNPISGYSKKIQSTVDGKFIFYNVPYSTYLIKSEAKDFIPASQNIDVRSSISVEVNFTLKFIATAEMIVIDGRKDLLEVDSSSTHVDIDKSLIQRFPAVSSSKGIESILLSAPGFIADENGRFHFRGSHGQITYMVDGIPMSDQMNLAFSNSIDPNNIESMEVITGNMLPEYGGRNSAVVNMVTRSSLGASCPFFGSVTFGGARFSTGEITAQLGGSIGNKFGYFTNFSTMRSNRFSDPLNFSNLHNSGNSERIFTRLDYTPTPSDIFRFSIGTGRNERQIPHLFSQHLIGQDQSSITKDLVVNFAWQHYFNSKIGIDFSPYYRTTTAQLLENSPFSIPVSVQQDRHLTNYGFSSNLSYDENRGNFHNHFKTGLNFSAFPISENFNFAITSPDFNSPKNEEFNPNLLPFDLTRGGNRFYFTDEGKGRQYSFFVQDSFTYRGLTLTGGIRYDNYRFRTIEDSFQPRIGISYYISSTGTVVRASYNRIFMPPFNENLLLAGSTSAAVLVSPEVVKTQGSALATVKAERQNFYEVGIQQRFKNWFRMDFSYWTKDSKQASDNLQFFNTGVVFPVAFSSAKLKGFDFRLDVPERHGFSGYWSIGTAKAIYTPPFMGGLFLDPEVTAVINEGPFRIDHDQKVSSQVSVQYNQHRQGWWIGLMNRYDSGLVTEIEDVEKIEANPDLAFGLQFINFNSDPTRVKGRSVWNLSAGYELFRNESYKIELQAHLLNFMNEKGLYNFLSVFSGTHVIPPRSYAMRVKFNF